MARNPSARRAPRRRAITWQRALFILMIAAVGGIGVAVRALAQLPIPDAGGQEATTVLLDRRGTPIAHLRGEAHRLPLTLEQVSPVLIDAVVASEDRDFFSHSGVDPVAIGRAAWFDIRRRGEVQGGSTITQQYVKNAHLNVDRTLLRKLHEAVLSIKIERELTKPEILERYLNVIYMGRGAYGVEAASQVWFGRSANDLNVSQAAYLAGLIRAPELADISRPGQVAEAYRRRDSVLRAMREEGLITEAEFVTAISSVLEDETLPRREVQSASVLVDGSGLEFVVDMVRRELLERFGPLETFAGGLTVRTTIDLEAQLGANASARSVTDIAGAPAVSIVVLDELGQVRALVGGPDFQLSQVNLATGRAGGGGGRQPGSAFKPIVLAHAIAAGIGADRVYPSPPSTLLVNPDGGPDWEVANDGGRDYGEIDLATATVLSSNTVYAALSHDLDLIALAAFAGDMGVRARLEPLPSIVLGAQELSVLDMASAYSTFAAGGRHREPSVIAEVIGRDGATVARYAANERDVLDEAIARDVTSVLRDVIGSGTGSAAAISGLDVAGKTGTSQSYRDAWFVGYSPRFTTAVWMGYPDDGRPMTDVLGLAAVTGGTHPARIWSEVMTQLHAGVDTGAFPWETP